MDHILFGGTGPVHCPGPVPLQQIRANIRLGPYKRMQG